MQSQETWLLVGGAVERKANSFESNNIESFHIKSMHPSNQVWLDSDCAVNANNTLLVDSITPYPHSDTPMRVQVDGDLSVCSSNMFAESVNGNLYVQIKDLEASAVAISNQIGVSSDLAMLCKKPEIW